MAFIQHNFTQITQDITSLILLYAQKVQADVDPVMRQKGGDLRTYAVEGSPVDTGAFRAAWQGPTKLGHAHYEVRNETDYGPIIELGGYRGVGPKTSEQGGETLPGGIPIGPGIYPTQRPAAPMRRAVSRVYVEVAQELVKVLKQ